MTSNRLVHIPYRQLKVDVCNLVQNKQNRRLHRGLEAGLFSSNLIASDRQPWKIVSADGIRCRRKHGPTVQVLCRHCDARNGRAGCVRDHSVNRRRYFLRL